MANEDTGVSIFIQSNMDAFAKAMDAARKSTDAYAQTLEKMGEKTLAAFNIISKSLQRTDNISTKNLKTKLDDVAEALTDFMGKFNEEQMKNKRMATDAMATSMNGLADSLSRFRKLPTIDFSNFAISGINDIDTSSLNKMIECFKNMANARIDQTGRAIQNLANGFKQLETIQFDSNMAGNLKSQMTAAAETLKTFMSKLEGFNVDGFARLTQAMRALPKAMQAMEKLDVSKIGQIFGTLANEIHPFIAKLKEGGAEINSFNSLISKLSGLSTRSAKSELKNLRKEIGDTGSEADKTRRKLSNMLSFGKMYAFYNQIRHYGSGFMNLLTKSIDFAEIENYFSRAMGNMRAEAMKFQETLAETFGMATPEMMQAQATFKNMIGSLGGIDEQTAYGLSERITKMVLDYSSLYNTTINSAITKFQAALSKQVKYCPLYMGMYSEFLLIAGNLSLRRYGNQQVSIDR